MLKKYLRKIYCRLTGCDDRIRFYWVGSHQLVFAATSKEQLYEYLISVHRRNLATLLSDPSMHGELDPWFRLEGLTLDIWVRDLEYNEMPILIITWELMKDALSA